MRKMFFATNEVKDAVFSLKMADECLAKVGADNLYWKWFFIALHNALQGFMVTCLCPFNPLPVMQETPPSGYGSRKEWETWQGEPDKPPRPPLLLKFMDLYELIKKPACMGQSGGKAFQPKGTQGASVKLLNSEFRNPFVHFIPESKSRLVEEILPVVKDVIGMISFLALDSECIGWVGQGDLRLKAEDLVTSISEKIREIRKMMEVHAKERPVPNPEMEAWAAAILERIESSREG